MHGQQATDPPSSPRTYEKGNTHELISGEDLKEYSAHLLSFWTRVALKPVAVPIR